MTYRLHGLTLTSDVPLPDLRAGGGEEADVVVTRARDIAKCETDRIALTGDAAKARLFLPDVATYDLSPAHMHVIPHCDDPEALRTFLLGSAWAVLLHQRGLLPLHGCALAWDGAAWLFVGESGAGKSTLVAGLLAAGAQLVSDDVTAIEPGGFVSPGPRSMKLARSAAAGVPGEALGPTHDGLKMRIVPDALAPDRRYPLAGVVALERGVSDTPALVPIGGSQACTVAIRHSFRGVAVAKLGIGERHLAACAALPGAAPFFQFERPWDIARVGEIATWLRDALPPAAAAR